MKKRCLFEHILFVGSCMVLSSLPCLADGKIYPSKVDKVVPDNCLSHHEGHQEHEETHN